MKLFNHRQEVCLALWENSKAFSIVVVLFFMPQKCSSYSVSSQPLIWSLFLFLAIVYTEDVGNSIEAHWRIKNPEAKLSYYLTEIKILWKWNKDSLCVYLYQENKKVYFFPRVLST